MCSCKNNAAGAVARTARNTEAAAADSGAGLFNLIPPAVTLDVSVSTKTVAGIVAGIIVTFLAIRFIKGMNE